MVGGLDTWSRGHKLKPCTFWLWNAGQTIPKQSPKTRISVTPQKWFDLTSANFFAKKKQVKRLNSILNPNTLIKDFINYIIDFQGCHLSVYPCHLGKMGPTAGEIETGDCGIFRYDQFMDKRICKSIPIPQSKLHTYIYQCAYQFRWVLLLNT